MVNVQKIKDTIEFFTKQIDKMENELTYYQCKDEMFFVSFLPAFLETYGLEDKFYKFCMLNKETKGWEILELGWVASDYEPENKGGIS